MNNDNLSCLPLISSTRDMITRERANQLDYQNAESPDNQVIIC